MERTEEQKIARAPITVILGGKEYEIVPLVIRDSREWRKKLLASMAPLPQLVKITMEKPEEVGSILNQILGVMPDDVVDLFFGYAKDLDRDEIEGIATDLELAQAFEEVVTIAFPLANSLPKAMKSISQ